MTGNVLPLRNLGPGLSLCSAHGPRAPISREFHFAGAEDPNDNNIAEERVFDNFFGGSSLSDPIPEGFSLEGGTVLGEDVAVGCEFPSRQPPNCEAHVKTHAFVHAHGVTGGNFIGPTTASIWHKKGIMSVQIIIPDGEILIADPLSPEFAVYCETDGEVGGQNCFSLD